MGKPSAAPELNLGQQFAMDALDSGRNVFLTGDAGTGKSFVLNEFLRHHCEGKNVVACAPTGIAALNLYRGSTIHRAFKINPSSLFSPDEVPKTAAAINEADVIVVDEISMCRCDLFDRIARSIRAAEKRRARKRGPVQLIVVGDFMQLPPVMKSEDRGHLLEWYPGLRDGWAFEARYWDAFEFVPVLLTQVVRQDDPEFVRQLSLARKGDAACLPYFNARVVKKAPKDVLQVVPTNRKADAVNGRALAGIPRQRPVLFEARSAGSVKDGDKPAPDELTLKVGARVMATVNDSEPDSYQNGSLGTVTAIGDSSVEVDFDEVGPCTVGKHTWSVLRPEVLTGPDGIKTVREEVVGEYTQIPLKLAYAATVHKSQGQTFDRVHVDPECFDAGQLYVALSRCRTIEGLTLSAPINKRRLRCSAAASEWLDQAAELSSKIRTRWGEEGGGIGFFDDVAGVHGTYSEPLFDDAASAEEPDQAQAAPVDQADPAPPEPGLSTAEGPSGKAGIPAAEETPALAAEASAASVPSREEATARSRQTAETRKAERARSEERPSVLSTARASALGSEWVTLDVPIEYAGAVSAFVESLSRSKAVGI